LVGRSADCGATEAYCATPSIRTTMNICGSVVTNEMEVASVKVAGITLKAPN
jgi:hypothetical protein